ncbi:uncharacterized protein LOC121848532 [Callorhinchus milii]|uniref:uncharacterized protein LOC121848532 n=1 Tax=Callorhinchus milii TaxID=7868 RepID=UPI001C3FB9F4|nr:uncharacterized protein LOC121848532 [Callorhinchus milii]
MSTRPSTAFSSISGSAGETSALALSARTCFVPPFNKCSVVTEFEGLFGDDITICLPTHKLQIEEFKPQLQNLVSHFNIGYNVDDITNTAKEMELFTLVIRKFRSIFSKGQTMKRFLVYDALEPGAENWGMKGPSMALMKEANWIPFLKVKPKQDPWQQKIMSNLKQQKYIDEILRLHSQFFQVSDPNRVMDALRQHAMAVHEPCAGQSQISYHSGQHANHIWNQIYGNADLYGEQRYDGGSSPVDIDEGETENLRTSKRMGSAFSSKKSKDQGYNYTRTMQQLGLDEGDEESTKDPAMTRGAYLSFLFLRHLRIGELQRVCLGILNYFRSIERTLTINTSGLTLNSGKLIHTAADTCWINAVKGGSATADGLGSHHYLHNTPADYKSHVAAFMEFSEIENLDDFYTMQESYIHTQDQRGVYIMYDVALQDVKQLEMQLLLLASQYIEKGKGCGAHQRLPFAGRLQSGNVDLPSWAHLSVDRFAVLFDLWSCEAAYLENKRQLLDSYFEAYQHVWDLEERFALAQVITDIMHKRPRFDLSDEYFVKTYEAEYTCLKLHFQLIRDILNKQIDEQREYVKRIWRDGQMEKVSEFGLPLNVIKKQPVAINNSCPALKRIYLLEFHPSLALASRIPKGLDHAYWELYDIHQPKVANESIILEKQVLQLALEKWTTLESPKASYSLQVQKDLFSDVFIEDPLFVSGVGVSAMEATDEDEKTQGGQRWVLMLNTFCRLLEIITLRHRLIEVSSETALLARLYKSVSVEMGFDEFHLYLRPVQFEFAAHKEKADQPPPVFITALLEDDSNVDRYIPSSLQLGIHEVDESQIGKFSFRSREAVLQLMARAGVDNIQVALACQTVQKNSLIAAVQQALCCPVEQAVHSTEPKVQ